MDEQSPRAIQGERQESRPGQAARQMDGWRAVETRRRDSRGGMGQVSSCGSSRICICIRICRSVPRVGVLGFVLFFTHCAARRGRALGFASLRCRTAAGHTQRTQRVNAVQPSTAHARAGQHDVCAAVSVNPSQCSPVTRPSPSVCPAASHSMAKWRSSTSGAVFRQKKPYENINV